MRLQCNTSQTQTYVTVTFPVTAFLTSLFGILITAATAERYGEAMWNPPDLLLAAQKAGGSGSRASTFFCAFAWTISQLGINVPGNLVRACASELIRMLIRSYRSLAAWTLRRYGPSTSICAGAPILSSSFL